MACRLDHNSLGVVCTTHFQSAHLCIETHEAQILRQARELDSAKSDAIALTSECGLLRVRAQKAEGDADGNYKAAKYAQGRVDELLEINASLLLRVATSDLQNEALKRYTEHLHDCHLTLHFQPYECTCGLSKLEGVTQGVTKAGGTLNRVELSGDSGQLPAAEKRLDDSDQNRECAACPTCPECGKRDWVRRCITCFPMCG